MSCFYKHINAVPKVWICCAHGNLAEQILILQTYATNKQKYCVYARPNKFFWELHVETVQTICSQSHWTGFYARFLFLQYTLKYTLLKYYYQPKIEVSEYHVGDFDIKVFFVIKVIILIVIYCHKCTLLI